MTIFSKGGIFTQSPWVPYEGATRDVDITPFGLIAGDLDIILAAVDNISVDGATNPREITVGAYRQTHTPAIPGTRAFNIVIDANSQSDTNSIVSEFIATGLKTGERGSGYQFDADTANSTGGQLNAVQVEKVGTGSAAVHAMHTGIGVEVIHQEVGTFGAIEQAFTYDDSGASFADVTTAFGSSGTNVQLFVEDNDIVYIGDDAKFGSLEVLLSIIASNPGVKPTFEYWNGSAWADFGPSDGTNGFRLNGVIAWSADELTGWSTNSVNSVTKYWVRITRTTNNLSTVPTESTIKVTAPTVYEWDEDGNIIANTLTVNSFGGNIGTQMGFFNGQFLETLTAAITSDGSTITMSLEKLGGGDLTMVFSDGFIIFDCTPAATITLTAGSDTVPQKNYVYIPLSTKVLTVSTSDWPTTEHIKVIETVLQSAAIVQTDNILVDRYWNDHASGVDGQGHMLHIAERLRYEDSTWWSGAAFSVNITTNVGTPDNVDIAVTSGEIYQLHRQTTSAVNTAIGDDFLVPNYFGANYSRFTDSNALLTDSTGASMSGRFFNITYWQTVSSNNENDELMANLPGGSYIRQSDATSDVSGYDNFTIPSDFRGYAFLVARATWRHQVTSGGTWTLVQITDLRGTSPNILAASGVSPFTTNFSDNNFTLFDEGDSTKETQFQLSGITTATTRIITMLDANGVNALTTTTLTQGSIPFADSNGVLTEDNSDFFWDNTNKRLGIGTLSPGFTLDTTTTGNVRCGTLLFAGDDIRMNFIAGTYNGLNGALQIARPGTWDMAINTGGIVNLSDRRYKKNIADMESMIDKVMQLKPSRYRYDTQEEGTCLQYGLIAQDVETVFPDLINTKLDTETGVDKLMLNSSAFSFIALKAIQDLKEEIDSLNSRITALENI